MTDVINIPTTWNAPDDLTPMEGLQDLLLQPVSAPDKISTCAEFVLNVHHEYLRKNTPGLPAGRVEKQVFLSFGNMLACENFSDYYHTLYGNPNGSEVFLSVYSDQSALLWLQMGPDDFAPVPVAFNLTLPFLKDRPSSLPFREPVAIPPHIKISYTPSLASFLSQHWWLDTQLGNTTWMGELDLEAALTHEARSWIEHLPHMPQVCIERQIPMRDGSMVAPAWGLYPQVHTDEEREILMTLADDINNVTALYAREHGLPEAQNTWISVSGRMIQSDGTLSNVDVAVGCDMTQHHDRKLRHQIQNAWKSILTDVMNSPSFPLAPILQVAQSCPIRGMDGRGLQMDDFKRQEIYSTFKVRTEHPSAHETMASIGRINTYMGSGAWMDRLPKGITV